MVTVGVRRDCTNAARFTLTRSSASYSCACAPYLLLLVPLSVDHLLYYIVMKHVNKDDHSRPLYLLAPCSLSYDTMRRAVRHRPPIAFDGTWQISIRIEVKKIFFPLMTTISSSQL